MIKKVQVLLDSYYRWLRKQTALRELKDWIEITTPYLDRHNDCLQIYVRRVNGGFELTDDGHIIEDLEHSGCNIYKTSKRRSLFKTTLNGFGVQDDRKALKVTASENNFALRKHNLIQAMLAVNDLFYLASPTTAIASTSGVRRVTPPQVTKPVVEPPPPPPDQQANKTRREIPSNQMSDDCSLHPPLIILTTIPSQQTAPISNLRNSLLRPRGQMEQNP